MDRSSQQRVTVQDRWYTPTLRLAREQVCNQVAASPTTLHAAVEQTITDLLDELLPPRRSRSYTRKKRPVKNAFPFRKLGQPGAPDKVTYTVTITGDRPYLGKRVTEVERLGSASG
jgi:hypothetical protein